jgi:hypothetical protein
MNYITNATDYSCRLRINRHYPSLLLLKEKSIKTNPRYFSSGRFFKKGKVRRLLFFTIVFIGYLKILFMQQS